MDHHRMDTAIDLEHALDKRHAEVLRSFTPDLFDLSDLPAARARIDREFEAMPSPSMPPDVAVSEVVVPGFEGDPDVRVKLYTPRDLETGAPAFLWIHGGGTVLLSADSNDFLCATRAARHRCLVASVDYRLAPETPAPGPVNDCYATLCWVAANASDLGVDPGHIVIGGSSAGGGLAAGTTIFARDQGGPMPSAQLLVFPMLDHTNSTPSSHAINDNRVWNRAANLIAWDAYLGGEAPTRYSSPTICDDLRGLPPAYMNVGTFDLFLDEDIAYAQALNRAGVACELRVYPGAFHLSQRFVADHPTSQRWNRDEEDFLTRALTGHI